MKSINSGKSVFGGLGGSSPDKFNLYFTLETKVELVIFCIVIG